MALIPPECGDHTQFNQQCTCDTVFISGFRHLLHVEIPPKLQHKQYWLQKIIKACFACSKCPLASSHTAGEA